MSRLAIAPASTAADLEDVAALFRLYAASLPVDLSYQDFAAELASLPGKYAPPKGALLIARNGGGDALGCVAIRPLHAPGCCEMKRLFIVPEGRGAGTGRKLTEAAIAHAQSLGYAELRLDTLPTMGPAIALYEQMGFRRTAAYYTPTPPGTIFMTKEL